MALNNFYALYFKIHTFRNLLGKYINDKNVATAAHTLRHNLIIATSRGLLETVRLSCYHRYNK